MLQSTREIGNGSSPLTLPEVAENQWTVPEDVATGLPRYVGLSAGAPIIFGSGSLWQVWDVCSPNGSYLDGNAAPLRALLVTRSRRPNATGDGGEMTFVHPLWLILLLAPAAWVVLSWRTTARQLPLLLKATSFAAVLVAFAEPAMLRRARKPVQSCWLIRLPA